MHVVWFCSDSCRWLSALTLHQNSTSTVCPLDGSAVLTSLEYVLPRVRFPLTRGYSVCERHAQPDTLVGA